MSKAVTKGMHWLPRQSQYSLHGRRNGRVDVLPLGASDQLYSIASQIEDGRERIEVLCEERQTLSEELRTLENVENLRSKHSSSLKYEPRARELRTRLEVIASELRRVRRHIGQLAALVGSNRAMTYEAAFVQVAKAEISEDAYLSISRKALAIATRIRGIK